MVCVNMIDENDGLLVYGGCSVWCDETVEVGVGRLGDEVEEGGE